MGVDPCLGEESCTDVIGSRPGHCNKFVTIPLDLTTRHQSVYPPSTTSTEPVTKLDASDARYSSDGPSSSGVA